MIVAPERSGPAIAVVDPLPAGITIVKSLNWEPVKVSPPTSEVRVVGSVAVVVIGTVDSATGAIDVSGVVVIVAGEDEATAGAGADETRTTVDAGGAEGNVATTVTDVVGTTEVCVSPATVANTVADVPTIRAV